jgi:membrane dipeptidase
VDRYPALLAELMRRGWKDDEIAKVAGENLLRVMSAAEAVSAKLQRTESASLVTIAELDGTTRKDK